MEKRCPKRTLGIQFIHILGIVTSLHFITLAFGNPRPHYTSGISVVNVACVLDHCGIGIFLRVVKTLEISSFHTLCIVVPSLPKHCHCSNCVYNVYSGKPHKIFEVLAVVSLTSPM